MEVTDLPVVNASLNALSAVLLAGGYYFIRSGQKGRHKLCMLAALASSCLFLTCYLVYHYSVGSIPFLGTGWIRWAYFTILISHIMLAVLTLPLAIVTARRALKGDFERHRRLARWTFPIWMYVSLTGLVIYWMLYQF